MFDILPSELIIQISENLDNYNDILNFKKITNEINSIIGRFSIVKKKFLFNIEKEEKIVERCVNINCYHDTKEIYEDYYYEYYGRYMHSHQDAMNNKIINIDNNVLKVFSPYCCECFKDYVLIGDKTLDEIRDCLQEDTIIIEYL